MDSPFIPLAAGAVVVVAGAAFLFRWLLRNAGSPSFRDQMAVLLAWIVYAALYNFGSASGSLAERLTTTQFISMGFIIAAPGVVIVSVVFIFMRRRGQKVRD